jgi:hypothetical protein
MLLPGLSLGSPWPAEAAGRIGAVFPRACDVELERGGLLVLAAADTPHLPKALRLDAGAPLDRLFRSGAPFRLADGVWRCGARTGSVRGLPIWRAPALGDVAAPPERRARLTAAERALDAHAAARPEVRLTLDLERLRGDLGRALASGEEPALDACVEALVGRGQGLTPSGDDLLVGALAFLARRSPTATRERLAAAISGRLDSTTTASRHYLAEAIAGRFSEPLALLADAIDAARPLLPVAAATRAALAVGASSGADGARGLLTAAGADLL